jgi:hypothetical protein
MKTTFRLEKSRSSDQYVSKFDVIDSAGAIVGRITVDAEDAPELLSHWCESPRSNVLAAAAATSKKRAIDAILEWKKGAPVAAPARRHENPMIDAMLRAAHKNRLSAQAILRG